MRQYDNLVSGFVFANSLQLSVASPITIGRLDHTIVLGSSGVWRAIAHFLVWQVK